MLQKNFDTLHPTEDSKRLQTLYIVSSMLNQVTAGLEMERILPRVLRVCLDLLEADSGSVFVLGEESNLEHAWMIQGDREISDVGWAELKHILTEGLAGQVIREGEPVRIDNSSKDPRWYSLVDVPGGAIQSAVCVPLKAKHNRAIGTITVTKHGANQFDAEDLSLLTAIAEHASSAISNAQLYENSLKQANTLSELVQASTSVASSLDAEKVIRAVAEHITRLLNVEATAILEWNQQTEELTGRTLYVNQNGGSHLPKQDRLRLNSSPLIQDILVNPRPVQINTESSSLDNNQKYLLQRLGLNSLLIIPLTAHTQAIGLALIMDKTTVRVFRDQEITMVQTLGSHAAIAVQNARLYEEAQRQLRLMHLLNEAGKVINSSLDLDQIMQALLAQVNGFLHVEALSVALADSATNELIFTVAEGIGSDQIVGLRLPSNKGIAGWVMENVAPALVNDTTNDPRFFRQGDERTGHPTRAIIVAPLQVKGRVLGTIQAINPIDRPNFAEGDLQVLVNLANLASSAIANAQQFIRTQKAESRYMGLFQDSIDPIILTDKHGLIVEANSRACELLGYEREELILLYIHNLHPIETGVLGDRRFEPIKTQQVKIFNSEFTTRGNRRVVLEVYAKRIFVEDESNLADRQMLQWIYHDITEQVELEQMREDLTAMLFHDLQSPLGNVISSLELVHDELAKYTNPMMKSMVDVAMKSSQRLQHLIKSLLDINRLEAGHPIQNRSFTSILTLIDDAQESIQASLERRNIRLARDLPVFLPDLYVDEDMIRRVIINLLDNALKYSLDGQLITIFVREMVEEAAVIMAISDQGPGIADEYRQIIFDKFRRLQDDGDRKGLGLGLAFCRLAVEAHQGRIWVDSGDQGGARFNILIPIIAGED